MSTEMIRIDEVKELAKASVASGFFPGIRNPESALILMAMAQAEGLAPIMAMMRYDVIDGKPSKKSSAMLSDFLQAGGKVEWHEHSEKAAEATFSHPTGGSIKVRWDLDKAKAAGLLNKQNWQKYPEAMLHARCISSGVRFVYPAATGGLYDPTEVSDFEDNKNWGKLQDKAVDAEFRESKTEPIKEEKPAAKVSLPPVPDVVDVIPDEMIESKAFSSIAQFKGRHLGSLEAFELEQIICAMQDNRPKLKTDLSKSWVNAIEARSLEAIRNKIYTAMTVEAK